MQAHAAITPEEAEFNYAREHDQHLSLQERMRHPIAFHAEMMGDIMYFHQAMRQKDAGEFVKAVVKEVNGHIKQKHRLYGPCVVSETSPPTPSPSTNQGLTSTSVSKLLGLTTSRHMPQ